nr:MAG TPA: Head to tail joining protein [Caudoviricetes sp.]
MIDKTHQTLFEEYRDLRLLSKFEQYSKWTVASVFPHSLKVDDLQGNDVIERDYQSMGAVLVNNLTAKLCKLLFPVGLSFFKLKDTKELTRFLASLDAKRRSLTEIENTCSERILLNAGYAQLHQLIKTLIVTGNALVVRKDNKLVVYTPRNYSVLRDADGTVLDTVLCEQISYDRVPEDIKAFINADGKEPRDTVDLYTRVRRIKDGRYRVSQQIEGHDVGEEVIFAHNLCPYIPVAWSLVNGDSYGHGLVEDLAGDFAKLSCLSEALAKYEIDACRVVNLVKSGSGGDIDALAEAEIGEWVQADPDAVGKTDAGDANMIKNLLVDIEQIIQRLSIAFMYASNVRDGERVTAEEIRTKVAEADQALGGVYSQLSEALHKPLAYLLLAEEDPKIQAAIIAGKVKFEILTGTAALGRGNDTERLLNSIQILGVIIPAMGQLSKRFNTEAVIDMILTNNGVTLDKVMKSDEQLEQEAQEAQAQMQAMQQQATALDASQAAGGMLQGF